MPMRTAEPIRVSATPAPAPVAPLLDRSLVFVTGKGGAGKTTVAAALGLASAARGRRTVVCDLAGSGQLARAYGGEDPARRAAVDDLHRPAGRAGGVAAPPARRRGSGRGAHALPDASPTSSPPRQERRSS